jgi:hypothetical protein
MCVFSGQGCKNMRAAHPADAFLHPIDGTPRVCKKYAIVLLLRLYLSEYFFIILLLVLNL